MSELWKKMFKETKKEKDLWKKVNKEREEFEASPEYIAHSKRMDDLFDELKEAQKERRDNAKEYRRKKFPRKETVESDEAREKRIAENKRIAEERINSYPEDLKNAIHLYNGLSKDEQATFDRETWAYHNELDQMQNVQITHKQVKELHDILVQTCIDFINENGLKDVDEVHFSADSLQESARFNEWTPSTDSYLGLEGMEWDDKLKFHVRRFIDKSF